MTFPSSLPISTRPFAARTQQRPGRAGARRTSGRYGRPSRGAPSLERHEDAVAELAVEGLGEVALAPGVLDQQDLAGADLPRLPVAGGDLHAGIEVDDVLSAWRRVPGQVVVGLDLAEDDARGGQARREPARRRGLDVLDLDVL